MDKKSNEERENNINYKYILRVTRVSFIMLFFSIMFSHAATSHAQKSEHSLNLNSTTIKEACKEIEIKTGFVFVFANNTENAAVRKVDLHTNNESISNMLDKLLSDTGLKYKVFDKQVVIYRDEKNSSGLENHHTSDVEKILQQQKITIRGTVVDEDNLPLPGVNIFLKSDAKTGTTSDIDGSFIITIVPSPNEFLVFSFVGMKNQEIPISPSMELILKIVLKADEAMLGEVVVTGIFNKAKESFTGAATSISSTELQEAGNRSLLTSIQNIDPSFNILQDITLGSDPNALPSINIRGSTSLNASVRDLQEDNKNLRSSNQPLFIMDGFEVSLSRFMDMDENRVESITLLKDNSATSLYGSRGANGVVVITTKRPMEGKLMITYNGSVSVEAPDLSSYSLLNAREKLEYEKAAGLYYSSNANQEQELLDLYNKRKIETERGVDTYWIKYPVRVGVGHKHGLRLEGGDKSIRFAGGLSYNNIAGTMKGSDRNTINGNMELQYEYKSLIFKNDLQVLQNRALSSPYGTFSDFSKVNAYWTPFDENGNLHKVLEKFYYTSIQKQNNIYNPLYDALLPQRNDSKYQLITNNFQLEWRFKEFFSLKGRLSIEKNNSRSDRYVSAKDTRFDNYTGDDLNRKGQYTYGTGEFSRYDGDLTLDYSQTFAGKHRLTAGLSYNIGETRGENYTIVAEGISNINMDFLGMASQYAKEGSPTGAEEISRRIGGVFTGNYTYDNRYIVDLSLRGEGSSRFGANRRFAPFWSVGTGWNMHHESFMKENETINAARWRLSYGSSGSQDFSPYQALTTFRDYSGNNYHGWNGVYLLGIGNPDLGWQSTFQLNTGVELELFENRLRFNVDVYDKTTNNLLADINLPTSSGFTTYKANVGKVSNRGFETTANVFLIRNKQGGLSWSVGGSIIHNSNKIMEISNSLKTLNEELRKQSNINPTFMFEEGQSIHTIYAVRSKGIDPGNGKEIFIKNDGSETYTWDANDLTVCGVNMPKYQGNANTNLRFKGFTLNAFFSYRLGGQMYNYTLVSKVENIVPYNNADKRVLYDRWKQPGDRALFKGVNDFSATYLTSRFVMDENTLSLSTLSLGYELPSGWVKKHLFLDYLSVKGSTEDVFYISSIKQERGLSYPYSNKYSLSITARF